MSQYMLTTIDNPFSPFDEFDDWYRYDEDQKYCSCSYLARVADLLEETRGLEEDEAFDAALDDICKYNLLGLYKKVKESDYKNGKWKPYDVSQELEKAKNKEQES